MPKLFTKYSQNCSRNVRNNSRNPHNIFLKHSRNIHNMFTKYTTVARMPHLTQSNYSSRGNTWERTEQTGQPSIRKAQPFREPKSDEKQYKTWPESCEKHAQKHAQTRPQNPKLIYLAWLAPPPKPRFKTYPPLVSCILAVLPSKTACHAENGGGYC